MIPVTMIRPRVGFESAINTPLLLQSSQNTRRIAARYRIRLNIYVNDRSGSDDRSLANGHAGHDAHVETQPHIRFDSDRTAGFF
jgi:hypothetical protein